MINPFEKFMQFAEKVDGYISRHQMAAGALMTLIVISIAYAVSPAPPAPVALYPENNATEVGLKPTFRWIGSGVEIPLISRLSPNSQLVYDFWLGTDEDHMNLVGRSIDCEGGNSSLELICPLAPETAYLWQITATNRLFKATKSPIWRFDTMAPPAINRFESDIITANLAEPVTLSWSVANASEITLYPGPISVPSEGSATFVPQKSTVYKLTAKNEVDERSDEIFVAVLSPRSIDGMESGWRAYKDRMGATQVEVDSTNGVKGGALEISYYLVRDGWVGISKNVSENQDNISSAEEIGFFYKIGGTQNAIEMRLTDKNGTVFGHSWGAVPIFNNWTQLRAKLEDFECRNPGDGGPCDEKLDWDNITNLAFFVSDREGRMGGIEGWIALDEVWAFHKDWSP